MCAALLLISRFCHVFVRSTAVARDGKQRTFFVASTQKSIRDIEKRSDWVRKREGGCEDKTVFAVILRCVAPI